VTNPYVLKFDAKDACEHDLVGGKGANLGRMTAASFPVPPGFTVTTAAYSTFLEADGLSDAIVAQVDGLEQDNAEALERGTARIRELIVGKEMPAELATEITRAYSALGRSYVAVRSSGIAEDLAEASFAGMHDTYLDIYGDEALLDAVKRCWASLWTARAASYRNTRGFRHDQGIAVVVQTMVPSEVAGVMFTANPMTAATDEIVINASWGLGEAIVSGITTPDEYVSHHQDLRVIERRLGAKEKIVVRDPVLGSGTVVEDVPAARRDEFTLSDAQVKQLADLGRRVQAYYSDFPQDIEWGFAGDEFYLLQSRPVTGVALSWDADVDAWQKQDEAPDDQVWTRSWSDNIWNGAVTPLMYSFRARSFTEASEAAQTLYDQPETAKLRMWKYHRAGVYYNCALEKSFVSNTSWPAMRPGMLENLPPAWHQEVLNAPFNLAAYLKLQMRCQFLNKMHGVATWRKAHDYFLVTMKEPANGISDAEMAQLGDSELIRYIEDIFGLEAQYIAEVWTAFFVQARDSFGLLALIVGKWYDGPRKTAFTDLITGVPRPTAAMVETYQLWKLADEIRSSAELRALFDANEGRAFFEAAAHSEAGRAWLGRYDEFVAEHGHRGHADRDIYYLRRAEDPAVDYRALAAFLAAERSDDPAIKEREIEARRLAVVDEVAENIRRKSFGGLRVEVFKATLDYVMTFLLFRDDERHWVDRTTFTIKRGYKEIARRLAERGVLTGERDYFFLTGQELYRMLEGGGNLTLAKAKLEARKRNFDRIDKGEGTNPMYLVRGRDADLDFDGSAQEDLPDGTFRGIGTSGGVVEGTARVVKELTDIGRVKHGEILVTNSTDPGWTPVFLVINAIVLETGGLLAHGSCLAREYGMPAVQLAKGMQLIPDGARIRIDGDKGMIEILDIDPTAVDDPSRRPEVVVS
jgi:pyruvate,water dikinase